MILITGGSGQVGQALTQTLLPLGKFVAPSHAELDLGNPESIRSVVRELRPQWIVNAGAYTAVDKAESEPDLAFHINAEAPRILAEEAAKIGAIVIHFSTDYVFDGSKPGAYLESDSTSPLNVYGRSKVEGEEALAGGRIPHLIVRTSWVYGATGKNFLRSILRFARDREHLRIVADQHGAPTWSFDLASMTAYVMEFIQRSAASSDSTLAEAALSVSGIYHASGAGETTWFGFASTAVEMLRKRDPSVKLASIEPISTAQYPTPARRPLNSLLDCSKLNRTFGWRMMAWEKSLNAVMAAMPVD